MKSITKIVSAIIAVLFYTNSIAQIKNTKTETVKIYGNCEMCKATIEKAGSLKKIAKVVWDDKSKMATLTYDDKKTNQDEILKRIALAGYDSDNFLAPDDVYAKLHGCCKYERVKKTVSKNEPIKENNPVTITTPTNQQASSLSPIFNVYFLLKDALVKTDGVVASTKAKDLLTAINSIKMETLKAEEHTVWMKLKQDLITDATHITETKEAGHQRDHFATLSKNIYELLKVSKQSETIYYQHCPMYNDGKGADWLSKENAIKNPYYGSQMISCGKTIETIK
jgi:copper chaperone CopZ